jgi:hypothetical protein
VVRTLAELPAFLATRAEAAAGAPGNGFPPPGDGA